MRKILLLAAAAILLAANTQARIIEPAENQVWWGYFNESDFTVGDYTIGTGSPMALMGAIYVPANHEQLGKSTVMGARIYLSSSAVSSLSGLRIWISKTLPNKVTEADIVQTTLGTLAAGANDFKFRTSFEVDNQGFYVGYYVKSTTGYFIRMGGADAPNASWIGNPEAGMSWTDLNGNGLGKLAFQILVEGGNFPDDCVTADDFGQKVVLQGETASVPITVTNQGSTPVNSIAYTITTEGGSTSEETSLTLPSLPLNGSTTINVPFPSDEQAKKYQKTFTITQVNGKPNTATHNSATGFLITLKEKLPVTPVIEEFTGTWCGWCPRGTVGMEKVHEAYGDQVVQIAAHNGDPMAIPEYQTVINTYTSGFPNSITDRQFEADPSFASLKTALDAAFNRVAPASIGLTAEWESAAKTKVVFKTTTRFAYDDDNTNYGIAFVLIEDGMTGTGSSWAQANYYSGNGTGEMAWWGQKGSSVTGIEFNHVVVAAWSAMNGVNNSVPKVVEAGADQEFTYSASIANNTVIQDKTKLKAAVLLIDRSNGTIVNAAQCAIADFATGIQVTIDAAGYATLFSTGNDLEIPEGVQAYTGIVNGEWLTLNEIEGKIPAGTAVVLKGEQGTYKLQTTTDAAAVGENDLKGTAEPVAADGTQYVLAEKDGVVGFYMATPGTTIPAGKAYIEYSGADVKGFYFGDDATGISLSSFSSPERKEGIFNLSGQRISKMQEGINIINGKKILK